MELNKRPIGVFDSGLGGLTCMRELMRVMPHEDIVYLGDTGRVPYGTRSNETIVKYTLQDIAFLTKYDVKYIVIACGTVSSVALDRIDTSAMCPIVGVVDSAIDAALAATKSGRIGVLGTPATIASGSYEKKLKAKADVQVIPNACPLFVPLVENGYTQKDDPVLRLVAQEYLAPLLDGQVDTIILGCTHYPLLKDAIAQLCPGIALIDVGQQAALTVSRSLSEAGLAATQGEGKYRFFVTDTTENFAHYGSIFLNQPINGQVERVELT